MSGDENEVHVVAQLSKVLDYSQDQKLSFLATIINAPTETSGYQNKKGERRSFLPLLVGDESAQVVIRVYDHTKHASHLKEGRSFRFASVLRKTTPEPLWLTTTSRLHRVTNVPINLDAPMLNQHAPTTVLQARTLNDALAVAKGTISSIKGKVTQVSELKQFATCEARFLTLIDDPVANPVKVCIFGTTARDTSPAVDDIIHISHVYPYIPRGATTPDNLGQAKNAVVTHVPDAILAKLPNRVLAADNVFQEIERTVVTPVEIKSLLTYEACPQKGCHLSKCHQGRCGKCGASPDKPIPAAVATVTFESPDKRRADRKFFTGNLQTAFDFTLTPDTTNDDIECAIIDSVNTFQGAINDGAMTSFTFKRKIID